MTENSIIENIIASKELPQDVIDYMRKEGVFPPTPDIVLRVKNFEMDIKPSAFTPDFIEEQMGIRPRYIGGLVFDPVSFTPQLQIVFEKFTMEFELEPVKKEIE